MALTSGDNSKQACSVEAESNGKQIGQKSTTRKCAPARAARVFCWLIRTVMFLKAVISFY